MTGAAGITAVGGIQVGHTSDLAALTGCTVILCRAEGAVAAVDARGSAPATHETDLLRPGNLVERVHAILLTGGSAFGLAAVEGVMRYLEERGVGFEAGVARVPIVPAAALFDLGVGRADVRPTAAMGYQACLDATDGAIVEGRVGAGTGATVGKIAGPAAAMQGGVGTSCMDLGGGVRVGALAVVNAFGDVRDESTASILAGARAPDGSFIDTAAAVTAWTAQPGFGTFASASTTLAVVATNAGLTRTEATVVARLAHDGLARVLSPSHTLFDGDVVFVLSTGDRPVNRVAVGVAAAQAVARAITRAVRIANAL